MVHVGDRGRDPGTFCAWPVLCAYFMAARGEVTSACDIVKAMKQFWDVYASALVDKTSMYNNELSVVLRSALGWCGAYAFLANFLLGLQRSYMPFHLVSCEAADMCLAALVVTGVKCMEHGFLHSDPCPSVDDLWRWFEDLIKENIELLEKRCLP